MADVNESIKKMIDPSWIKTIRAINNQTNSAVQALQNSEAFRNIDAMAKAARLTSAAFDNSEVMKYARAATESSRLASLAFHETQAMDSIRRFAKSAEFANLAFQESEALKSIRALAKISEVAVADFQHSEAAKGLEGLARSSQLASVALGQSRAFQELNKLSKLDSFRALANFKNSPFSELLPDSFGHQQGAEEVTDGSILEIDYQVREEILSEKDFNALSEKTKEILSYLYYTYFLPVILSCISAYMMTNALETKNELKNVSTPVEVRSFVRNTPEQIDRTALQGYRVTTADSLNFRDGPSMKSGVTNTLPLGTLVEVVDKSHKSWLLIEVEINGVLDQGWVSRRYTTYFK